MYVVYIRERGGLGLEVVYYKWTARLGYTGLLGGLEHLKIKTRLIDDLFVSVMCEFVFLK